MAIPQTIRINPLDLQENIAVGISLPFNGPNVFNKTYSTTEQIKSNLINLLLTNKGERIFNPEFGSDLKKVLFESIIEDNTIQIQELIINNINAFIPEIWIDDVIIDNQDKERNIINITINYIIKISGSKEQINIEFT